MIKHSYGSHAINHPSAKYWYIGASLNGSIIIIIIIIPPGLGKNTCIYIIYIQYSDYILRFLMN